MLPIEPEAASVASKPNNLPLKHHKCVKEELTNLQEVGLIERSLCSYTAPIKTKRLVIDYCELN